MFSRVGNTLLQLLPLGGVGKVTEQVLKLMNMTSMGDVYNHLHEVIFAFTPAIGEFLLRYDDD